MRAHYYSNWKLSEACRCVNAGGIIAYPTEAVFGLGCHPGDPQAVARLLAIKRRPLSKGLILVAADRGQLDPWIQALPARLEKRLQGSWPGPTTWLVPAAVDCPPWLTGVHRTLAVRVSAHPLVSALCQRLGHALVSTSANVSTLKPARSVLEVQLRFVNSIDYILTGTVGGRAQPTTIRDLESGKTIRI